MLRTLALALEWFLNTDGQVNFNCEASLSVFFFSVVPHGAVDAFLRTDLTFLRYVVPRMLAYLVRNSYLPADRARTYTKTQNYK